MASSAQGQANAESGADSEKYFNNTDGVQLLRKTWMPNGPPRAIVFIAHGFAEHCLCYHEPVCLPLTTNGFLVVAHDHLGHGRSGGDRCANGDINTFVRDVLQTLQEIQQDYPNLPIFIFGHSMGGLIALTALLRKPELFKGAILDAALIQLDPAELSQWKKRLVRFVSCIFPGAGVSKLDLSYCCRDPKVVESLQNDQHRYFGPVKAKVLTGFLDAMQELGARMEEIRTPLLIFHGTADHLTCHQGSMELDKRAASLDKQLVIYQDAYHQLHLEPYGVKEEFMRTVLDWLLKRC